MRENVLAWRAFFLLAADGQLRARQSDLNIRGAHARQLHLHDHHILHFAEVYRREPGARHGRDIRLRSLLQSREEVADAVAQFFQLDAL
jgi:hypothetical protein